MLYRSDPPKSRDFKSYSSISRTYGAKAAGLMFLPKAWCPEYCALPASLYERWKKGSGLAEMEEVRKLVEWANAHDLDEIILRSSGTHESIYDRGKYQSLILGGPINIKTVAENLSDIFSSTLEIDGDESLGIVAQDYKKPVLSGHLSNEYRVSPTINQWRYELESPNWNPAKGINSKLTTSPDPSVVLRCGNRVPHQPLRSFAHYLAEHFSERSHVEWLVCDGVLWIVQLDFEWKQLENGCDPRTDLKAEAPPSLDLEKLDQLDFYRVGASTKWPKLQNLSDFDFADNNPGPRIYSLSPRLIDDIFSDTSEYERLHSEITALTGGRLVVRTDCIQTDIGHFNLPRTDTVDGNQALNWCRDKIRELREKGVSDENFVFLFHAFLPSRSSAWAYATPDSPTVIVDALWGLPDGLQVLPVDTYEVNVSREKIIDTRSTYKPKFLTELPDGTWDYQSIRSRSARGRVLGKADILEVAKRTHAIASKLGEQAQIMWFCEIPQGYRVGRNLPWFRSREKLDPAPRQQEIYRPIKVSTLSDLASLPNEKVTLKLAPEANLIRNEEFLNQVISTAKDRGLPVELEGSILGHTYYRLNEEQIPVILANEPKYHRQRQKQVFGKIVRDKIPRKIAEAGEAVREAKLAREDLALGLAGKLLEEVGEYLRATDAREKAGEIADLFEVLNGIASASGVEWSNVVALAEEKKEKRGGFQEGRVLVETSLPGPDTPMAAEGFVTINELGRIEAKESSVEIPATTLLSTARGPSITELVPKNWTRA